jgi:Ca2+-binding RTX toxin-like protein
VFRKSGWLSVCVIVSVLPFLPVARASEVPRTATVRVVDGVLRYRAAPFTSDELYLRASSATDPITSVLLITSAATRAGPGCDVVSAVRDSFVKHPHWVRCVDVRSTRFELGSGKDLFYDGLSLPNVVHGGPDNDRVYSGYGQDSSFGGPGDDDVVGGPGQELFGGPGNDTVRETFQRSSNIGVPGARLRGGPGDDELSGGRSDDVLLGGVGADVLWGGLGDDRLVGGAGGDEMSGGGGPSDVISYAHRTSDISVSDDGVANDGASGEGDDVLPADPLDRGLSGTEIVEGGSGDDSISVSGERVRVFGNDGDDHLTSTGGPAALFGGPGGDILTASAAPARVRGATGNDVLSTSDGSADRDGCGPGTDEVTADGSDAVNANCENVSIT